MRQRVRLGHDPVEILQCWWYSLPSDLYVFAYEAGRVLMSILLCARVAGLAPRRVCGNIGAACWRLAPWQRGGDPAFVDLAQMLLPSGLGALLWP